MSVWVWLPTAFGLHVGVYSSQVQPPMDVAMRFIRDMVGACRRALAPVEGEVAATTRWDWPYSIGVLAAALVVVAISVELEVRPMLMVSPIGLAILVLTAFFGVFLMGDDSEESFYRVDYTGLATSATAAAYGPLVGALLAVVVDVVAQLPRRRVIGGPSQLVLSASNGALFTMAQGWAFLLVFESTGSLLVSVLALEATGRCTNILINIGWCIAGSRPIRELLAFYVADMLPTQLTTMILYMGIVGMSVEPFAVVGLAAPMLLNRLQERTTTQLRAAESSLMIDPLTGIHNRRYFWNAVERAIVAWKSIGTPVHVAMIDVDNFKMLNDTHGHLEGDRALQSVATALREICAEARHADVSRFGGEEFSVIVTGMDAAEAARLCEQMRVAALEALAAWGTSISLGVATARRETETPQEVTGWADQALYVAKTSGKNRVVIANEMSQDMLHRDVA